MELNFKRGGRSSLDSCIILRFLLRDVPEQVERARRLLLSGDMYYIDEIAIMEVVHVMLKTGYPRIEIAEYVQGFLSNPMLKYDNALFDPVFEKYKTHPSLSFDDLVLAAHAEKQGNSTLWTFDKKFASQVDVAKLVPAN